MRNKSMDGGPSRRDADSAEIGAPLDDRQPSGSLHVASRGWSNPELLVELRRLGGLDEWALRIPLAAFADAPALGPLLLDLSDRSDLSCAGRQRVLRAHS